MRILTKIQNGFHVSIDNIRKYNIEQYWIKIAKKNLGEYPELNFLIDKDLTYYNVLCPDFLDALILSSDFIRKRYLKSTLTAIAEHTYSDPNNKVFPRFGYDHEKDEIYLWKSVGKGHLAIPKSLFSGMKEFDDPTFNSNGLVKIISNTKIKDSKGLKNAEETIVGAAARYRDNHFFYLKNFGIGIKIF